MHDNSAAIRRPDRNERHIANDLSRFVLLGNRVRSAVLHDKVGVHFLNRAGRRGVTKGDSTEDCKLQKTFGDLAGLRIT